MKHTPHAVRRTLLTLLAALCLWAGAAAQTKKEDAKEFKPTREQTAEAARLRTALAAALGDNFEITHDRLARRSNYYGGGLYWLAHLRAAGPAAFTSNTSTGTKTAYTPKTRSTPSSSARPP